MKTIGLIGGMSWESTIPYYQIINEKVKEALGGFSSGKILLYSVDFAELEDHMSKGEWDDNARILTDIAQRLETFGADMVLICTNTMHKLAPQVAAAIGIPLVHIADATADALEKAGIRKVALLGTRYTMKEDFYKDRLAKRGFTVLIPEEDDIEEVNRIIFDELCLGEIKDGSRAKYVEVIEKLREKGAEGVILGCTEIGMLIQQKDSPIPVFDTTVIHAERAAELALEG